MVRYALMWLVLGTVAALAIIAALGGGGAGEKDVTLPPIRESDLESAAREAGCRLQRARRAERLNPPVDGPRGVAPARPGLYEQSPPVGALTAAARRGVIVIHYRTGLDETELDQLRALQGVVPSGTIVTPNATSMPFELAVVGYRRLLGCGRYSARAADAARLFHGRYLARGPESGGG